MNPREINRELHRASMRLMDIDCITDPDDAALRKRVFLPRLGDLLEEVEANLAIEVLAPPSTIMYNWLRRQHSILLESLMPDGPLDDFFNEVEAFANE